MSSIDPPSEKTLGVLEQITDLRSQWADEARDFTPWLAQSHNLQILADTIEMELETEGTEERIGPFRADIVARSGDGPVIIENQCEDAPELDGRSHVLRSFARSENGPVADSAGPLVVARSAPRYLLFRASA